MAQLENTAAPDYHRYESLLGITQPDNLRGYVNNVSLSHKYSIHKSSKTGSLSFLFSILHNLQMIVSGGYRIYIYTL